MQLFYLNVLKIESYLLINVDNMNEYKYHADMNLDVHMFHDNMYQLLLYHPMLLFY